MAQGSRVKFVSTVAAVVMVVHGHASALAQGGAPPGASLSFRTASVHFEQNATDGDAEVVFEVTGGAEGLTRLVVKAPDGRTVVDFTAPDGPSPSGMRQFRFESPEPADIPAMKAAYPPGTYTFEGTTGSGQRLHGTAVLKHGLPEPVTVVTPEAEAADVAVRDLEVAWTPIGQAAAYLVYVEHGDSSLEVSARLPGSTTTFAVPDGFLLPGTEYQLGVGVVTEEGNISFVETTFTTAK
jgi:hypothetical protein